MASSTKTHAQIIRNSFHGGEVSSRMEGRSDLDSVVAGCRKSQNLLVTDTGGLLKRPGFENLSVTSDITTAGRLIPFVPSRTSSYMLELLPYRMRIWKDGAPLEHASIEVDSENIIDPVLDSTGTDTNLFLAPEHGFRHGQAVEFTATTGVLPSGTSLSTEYYVVLERPHIVTLAAASGNFTCKSNHDLAIGCGPFTFWLDNFTAGTMESTCGDDLFVHALGTTPATDVELRTDRTTGSKISNGSGAGTLPGSLVPTEGCLRDTFRLSDDPLDLYGNLVPFGDSGTGTHTLSPKGNRVVEFQTPWDATAIEELTYVPSMDILLFFHKDFPPQELRRGDITAFSFGEMKIIDGPYGETAPEGMNTTFNIGNNAGSINANIKIDSAEGNMSEPYFTALDMGKPFRKAQHDDEQGVIWQVGHLERLIGFALQAQTKRPIWFHRVQSDQINMPTAHGLVTDEIVFFKAGTHPLPTGLTESTPYYVRKIDSDTIELSLTAGGAKITIADDGAVIRSHRIQSTLMNTLHETTGAAADVDSTGFKNGESGYVLTGHGRPPAGLTYGREYRIRFHGGVDQFYLEEMSGVVARVLDPGDGVYFIQGGHRTWTQARWRVDVTPRFDGAASWSTSLGFDVATHRWRIGSWGPEEGWPKAAAFVEQRLMTGNTYDTPHQFWVSESGDWRNLSPDSLVPFTEQGIYDPTTPSRGITDASGFHFEIGGSGDRVREILWLETATTPFLGTTGGLMELIASSQLEPLTVQNSTVAPIDRRNLADVKPVWGNDSLCVVNGAQNRINAVTNDRSRGLTFTNLSLYADHVFQDGVGVKQMAFQEAPYGILWVVKNDGTLWSCTLDLDNGIIAWSRHVIGGSGYVESVCSIPNSASIDALDEVYISVKRTINSVVTRHIERMYRPIRDGETSKDGRYMDAFAVYDGSPATTITGLDYLEGETVQILADGIRIADQAVSSGQITLAEAASLVVVGLEYSSEYESIPLEVDFESGTTLQGLPKKLMDVRLRLARSMGGSFGSSTGALTEIEYITPGDPTDVELPLFTGLKRVDYDGEKELEGVFTFTHDEPFPFFITALVCRLDWSDRSGL